MHPYSGLLRHHWEQLNEDWAEKKWKTGEMWCVLTVEHCTAQGQRSRSNRRNSNRSNEHKKKYPEIIPLQQRNRSCAATDIKCFSVYSPFRVNRCNVYPGRGSKRQRRRPSNDLVVRRPWPLPLAPWQRGQLQVSRETSPAAAQVNTQRAGRGCERFAEAAIGGLSVVLKGGRIKEHRGYVSSESQKGREVKPESTVLKKYQTSLSRLSSVWPIRYVRLSSSSDSIL